jgi:hypothetical protein
MVETEDMKKNHAFEQSPKKGQEERSLDEIHAEDKGDEKINADAGILAQVVNEKNNADHDTVGTPCFYSDGTPGVKCVACVLLLLLFWL